MTNEQANKVIVFDMDETLGHFEQINILWQSLNHYYKNRLNDQILFNLIDTFNLLLRPNIIKILTNLKQKKKKKIYDKIILFSNNPSKDWCILISNYFNYKVNYKLFDHIIAAFKYRGKQIEKNRSHYDKNYDDLLNSCKLLPNTKVCFIDDVYHADMENPNVYYVYIKPHRYSYDFNEMIEIFCNKNQLNDKNLKNKLIEYCNKFNYYKSTIDKNEYKLNNIVSKKINEHINTFLNT